MEKEFNTEGPCRPEQHYMADTSAKFKAILRLVELGKYFTINRPRQYGKTTMLFRVAEVFRQTGQYMVFRISFEGVGDSPFANEEQFCAMFLEALRFRAEQQQETALVKALDEMLLIAQNLKTLSLCISTLVHTAQRKIVVLIDEVDKSSNNQLFISFLGILRDKYLDRSETPTFHSVVLVGVHDVKSLKLKLRPDAEKKYNSPWNIAADFKVDMNLLPPEIRPMLEEYARDRDVTVDAQAVAERLFYYTSGYPFLVSKLCKMFDEELLPEKTERTWTTHDVDAAARQLLGETNTNFDETIKNLRNHPELYDLVEKMLIEGMDFSFDLHSDRINLGITFGILAPNQYNRLGIHNRIYRELILNYMSSNAEHTSPIAGREFSDSYCLPGNRFDVRRALLKFQELLKAEYSKKDRDFLERQGRLVFLAFLRPLLNGHGHAFKEPQSSEERRLDVVISYHQHRHVIELKIWRGPEAYLKGLDQLAAYLDDLGLDEGALLIFDHGGLKRWQHEDIVHQGKRILAVWV